LPAWSPGPGPSRQYLPGAKPATKIERARVALAELPALELAGQSLGGIGIPGMLDNWRASRGGGSRSPDRLSAGTGSCDGSSRSGGGVLGGAFNCAVRAVAPGSSPECQLLAWALGTVRWGRAAAGFSRASGSSRSASPGRQVHVSRLWRAHRPPFGDVRRRLRFRPRDQPGCWPFSRHS